MKAKNIFATLITALLVALATSLQAQDTILKNPNVPKIEVDSLQFKFELPDYRPKGVFVLIGWGKAPGKKILENPCIDGLVIRRYWRELQPGPKKYDWAELDSMFMLADSFGKKIHLMIAPGFYSPNWVLQQVVTDSFVVPQGHDKGKMKRLPRPWLPKYLNFWFGFVDALAERYGPHPALSLVSVTGPNGHNGEVNLPRNKDDADPKKFPDYDPIKRWEEIMEGGSDWEERLMDNMVGAYKKTINRFHKAFAVNHKKFYSLQIILHSLPIDLEIEKNRQIRDAYQDSLQNHALEKDGNFFVAMNGGLDGRPVRPNTTAPFPQWPKVLKLSTKVITGFQTRAPGNLYPKNIDDNSRRRRAIFEHAIRNGIGYGADFLELYVSDLKHESLQDLIAQASLFLSRKISQQELSRKCACLQTLLK